MSSGLSCSGAQPRGGEHVQPGAPERRSVWGGWSSRASSTLSRIRSARGWGGFGSPARAVAPLVGPLVQVCKMRFAARVSSSFSASVNSTPRSTSRVRIAAARSWRLERKDEPAAAGVEVGVGVGVLDGQGRLAQPADAMHRADDAELAQSGGLVEATHLGLPADEAGIVGRQVARSAGNPAAGGRAGYGGNS